MFGSFCFLGMTDFGFWLPALISVAIITVYHKQFHTIIILRSFYIMLVMTLIVSVLSYFCISDPFTFGFRSLDLFSSFTPLMYFLFLNHSKSNGTRHNSTGRQRESVQSISPEVVFPIVYIGTLFADCVAVASMPVAGYPVGTTNLFADIVQMLEANHHHFFMAPYAINWIGGGGLADGLLIIPASAVLIASILAWLMQRDVAASAGFVSANL